MKLSSFLLVLILVLATFHFSKSQIVQPIEENVGKPIDLDKSFRLNTFPNTGLYWYGMYSDESLATIDSIGYWMEQFNETPHILRRIIEVCGKYFYRLPDSTIRKQFLTYIHTVNGTQDITPSKWSTMLYPILSEQYTHTSEYWNVSLWDDDLYFYYNRPYGIPYSGYSKIANYYKYRIQNLFFEYDSFFKSFTLPEFNFVFNDICEIENNDVLRVALLFDLMEKLYSFQAFDYLNGITEKINIICLNSQAMSHKEKAGWLVGCAKALATTDGYSNGYYITSYLSHAEGLIEWDTSISDYYQTIRNLKARYLMSLPGSFGKWIATSGLMDDFEHTNLALQEKFKKEILFAQANLSAAYEIQNKGEIVGERLKLLIVAHIEQASNLYTILQNEDWSGLHLNREYYALLLSSIADYYWLESEYQTALLYRFYTVKNRYELHTNHSYTDYSDLYKLNQAVISLGNSYIEIGDTATGIAWIQSFCKSCGVDDVSKFFGKIPRDPRFYTNEHLEILSDSLENGDISIVKGNSRINTRYTKDRLKTELYFAAKYQFEKGNWEKAYTLLRKYINLGNEAEDTEFYVNLMMYGTYYKQVAEKRRLEDSVKLVKNELSSLLTINGELRLSNAGLLTERDSLINDTTLLNKDKQRLDNEIKIAESNLERTTLDLEKKGKSIGTLTDANRRAKRNMYIAIFIAGIAFVFALAFAYSRNRYKVLAFTNNQLSHFGKKVPEIIGYRLQENLKAGNVERMQIEIKKLFSLSTFFDTFYDKSTSRGITLSDELDLITTLINLEYNDENRKEYVKEKVIVQLNTQSDVWIPTFSIFNIIYNSFRRGNIGSNEVGKVVVNHQQGRFWNTITIIDNGLGSVKSKSKKGTGIKYVHTMIRLWNFYLLPRVRRGKRRDKEQGYEVSFSLLKRKYYGI